MQNAELNSDLSSSLKLQIPINKSRRDASPEASADTPGGVSLQCCTIDYSINWNLAVMVWEKDDKISKWNSKNLKDKEDFLCYDMA